MTEREAIHKLIMFRRILEKGVFPVGYKFDAEPFDMAISALEKQEQYCDTCKHGYFGDAWCERCAVRFASHYEAEEENHEM